MRHPRAAVVSVSAAAAVYLLSFTLVVQGQGGPSEAPAGFDNHGAYVSSIARQNHGQTTAAAAKAKTEPTH